METRSNPVSATSQADVRARNAQPRIPLAYVAAAAILVICSPSFVLIGQNSISAPPRPSSILLPEANHMPDANDKMLMNQAHQRSENFDAANALRERQINDESLKLLILARDLKAQMDKLGDKPVPNRLLREAEVIELLAHDVQTKMTLTVKGG
jgi:hypothetical protein